MFGILGRGSRSPLPDKRNLIRWVLFNFIIGNADAHAKNISLLHGEPGSKEGPRLAPFYDLVCTQIYDHLSTRQAQKIGGEYRFKRIASRHWDRFATSIGVSPKYLRSIGLVLCEKTEENAAILAEDIGRAHAGTETLKKIVQVIEWRVNRLRGELGG